MAVPRIAKIVITAANMARTTVTSELIADLDNHLRDRAGYNVYPTSPKF